MKTSKAELLKKSHLLVSTASILLEQAIMEFSNVSRRPVFDDYLKKAQESTNQCRIILSNLTRFSEAKQYDEADIDMPNHLNWIFEINNPQRSE